MFAPTKIWRRWHRKVNVTQKRHALASSIAASGIPALVMARGHKVEQIPEIPLVVDTKLIEAVDKTSKAIALLKSINAFTEIEKVKESRRLRSGKGKYRNRRYIQKKGPLLVYSKDNGFVRAFRNLPGLDLINVDRMNLLQFAPGGHLGRFVIWTKDAFERLDHVFGTYSKPSTQKKGYRLQRSVMANADLNRILRSEEIQAAIRPKQPQEQGHRGVKKNPLSNVGARDKLDPFHKSYVRRVLGVERRRIAERNRLVEQRKKGTLKGALYPKKIAKKKAIRKRIATEHKKFYDILLH